MPIISPGTGSTVGGLPTGQDATRTGISTQIIVKVGAVSIGAIKSIQIQENRPIVMINEVGTDGSIDATPNASSTFTASIQRTRFDRMRIAEAFTRGFVHVSSQLVPIDINIYDNWSGSGANAIITTLKDCWIDSISYTYSDSDWVIVDSMGIKFERIFSTLNSGSAATGGLRGPSILQVNPIEQASDTGNLPGGTLAVPGIINAFFP